MDLATVLAAINTATTLTPELLALFGQIKGTFGETDQAAIDQALADSTAAADAQHAAAQGM